MNDSSPVNESQPEPLSRSEARHERREARRASLDAPGRGAWIVGLILIILGVAFLMQTMGTFVLPLNNWWALFILIPAVGAFEKALRTYQQEDNRFTAAARGSLMVGIVLTLITASFLFNLNWAFVGPVLIILAGAGLLVNAVIPSNKE
jgi:hypothetical protein